MKLVKNNGLLIASRLREVILAGKWIANTNYKEQLSNLTWEQATTKIESLNTIAALTFHINYYIAGVLQVLQGGPLEIKDKFSFDFNEINSQKEWEDLKSSLWTNSEKMAQLTEQMTDIKLNSVFVDEKYGTYQRNLNGLIEHSYYHLGQITLIKKMITSSM